MFYLTDSFTSGERDTIPQLHGWRGENWNQKNNTYDKVLTIPEGLEKFLKVRKDEKLASQWKSVKKRTPDSFLNLEAANFFMLVYKEQFDLIKRWAVGEISHVFTKK